MPNEHPVKLLAANIFDSIASLTVQSIHHACDYSCTYIEDITWWWEDMNFMFEWQEQYLTSERSERVRYCSCHSNIKFISSSQRVMSSIYVSHVLQIMKYRYLFLEEKTLTEKSVTKVCLNFPRIIDYLIKYIKDLKSVWFALSNTLFGC